MNTQGEYVYSKNDLSIKFSSPMHKLDELARKLGYAIIADASLFCPQCNQPHQYFSRRDLDNLITENTVCL